MADSNIWLVTPEGLKSGDTLRDDYIKDTNILCPHCETVMLDRRANHWCCSYPWNSNNNWDCYKDAIYGCPACMHATCRDHLNELP